MRFPMRFLIVLESAKLVAPTLGAEQIPVISVRSNHGQKNVQTRRKPSFLSVIQWASEVVLLV